ncbi:ATP-binding protein [Natrialba swarupiae]|nr:ATP-binding protein [Natrialba swarupiae]
MCGVSKHPENAVQHNDTETPEITVRSETRDDRVAVYVADDGPGFRTNRKRRSSGKAKRTRECGHRIGLYLVETLVDRYGGEVWVEDNEPEGAVFVVELQRAR